MNKKENKKVKKTDKDLEIDEVKDNETEEVSDTDVDTENIKEKMIEINIDYKDMYFRAIADLDNYKRRISGEQENNRKMARFYVISEFLSLYNSLKQAESFIPKDVEKENWVIGIKMISNQFEKKISEMGVEVEHTVGKKFDHNLMEAISVENDDSKKEDLVLREISPCYKMDGIVIEHAKVIVNKL